jgi:hypothetical protein
MLVRDEATVVHVPGQDLVQGHGAGQSRLSVHVGMIQIERVQPEDQRFDVSDHVLDVVLQERQQAQFAAGKGLPLDRGRFRRLAQCRFHAGHVPLADLLRDEVPARPQVPRDRAPVEWRVPANDHVERLRD